MLTVCEHLMKKLWHFWLWLCMCVWCIVCNSNWFHNQSSWCDNYVVVEWLNDWLLGSWSVASCHQLLSDDFSWSRPHRLVCRTFCFSTGWACLAERWDVVSQSINHSIQWAAGWLTHRLTTYCPAHLMICTVKMSQKISWEGKLVKFTEQETRSNELGVCRIPL